MAGGINRSFLQNNLGLTGKKKQFIDSFIDKGGKMPLSVKFLLVASLYGMCGMLLGAIMGAQENFILMPVHAHLNLLGWIAIMLYGLTYRAIPELAESRLAVWHFYIVNTGILLLIPSLALLLLGNRAVLPVLVLGELFSMASLLMFMVNLWRNGRKLEAV